MSPYYYYTDMVSHVITRGPSHLCVCREEQDKEHAAKIAQKIKEEEDIQMALRMQDEAMAKKMQELEAKK